MHGLRGLLPKSLDVEVSGVSCPLRCLRCQAAKNWEPPVLRNAEPGVPDFWIQRLFARCCLETDDFRYNALMIERYMAMVGPVKFVKTAD